MMLSLNKSSSHNLQFVITHDMYATEFLDKGDIYTYSIFYGDIGHLSGTVKPVRRNVYELLQTVGRTRTCLHDSTYRTLGI